MGRFADWLLGKPLEAGDAARGHQHEPVPLADPGVLAGNLRDTLVRDTAAGGTGVGGEPVHADERAADREHAAGVSRAAGGGHRARLGVEPGSELVSERGR